MMLWKMYNWVFPKWLSLNSLNSMNHDKAQNWNGYQEYPCLVIVMFSDVVVKMKFILLCLDWYLFIMVIGNRYSPRGRKKVFSITIIGTVTMSRQVMQVAIILFLDLVMIHWIQQYSDIHLGKTLIPTEFKNGCVRATSVWPKHIS